MKIDNTPWKVWPDGKDAGRLITGPDVERKNKDGYVYYENIVIARAYGEPFGPRVQLIRAAPELLAALLALRADQPGGRCWCGAGMQWVSGVAVETRGPVRHTEACNAAWAAVNSIEAAP